MASGVIIVLIIVLLVIWIVTGVYITQATVNLRSFKDTDENLHTAHYFCDWAGTITWITVAIFIILVVASFFGFDEIVGALFLEEEAGGEKKSPISGESKSPISGESIVLMVSLFVALILVITTGILSTIGALNIQRSPNYNSTTAQLKTAYDDAIISSVLSIGSVGILIVGAVGYVIYEHVQNKNSGKISPTPHPPAPK